MAGAIVSLRTVVLGATLSSVLAQFQWWPSLNRCKLVFSTEQSPFSVASSSAVSGT
jgi:hypothetical protein